MSDNHVLTQSDAVELYCLLTMTARTQLDEHVSPEMMITIGHRAQTNQHVMRSGKRITWQTLTTWGRFE